MASKNNSHCAYRPFNQDIYSANIICPLHSFYHSSTSLCKDRHHSRLYYLPYCPPPSTCKNVNLVVKNITKFVPGDYQCIAFRK